MLTKRLSTLPASLLLTALVFVLAACDGLGSADLPTDTPAGATQPVPTLTPFVPDDPLPTADPGQPTATADLSQPTPTAVMTEPAPTPTSDTAPEPTPDLANAALSVSTTTVQPGQMVTLSGNGFPAGVLVEIGFGRVESEYDILTSGQAGAGGTFTIDVRVPDYADSSDQWVFVADVDNAKVFTGVVDVVAANDTDNTPEAGVNEAVNGLFSRTYMYLIAPEDGGQSGPLVGCEDSAVPVVVEIEPTIAPMTAAINRLLSLEDQYYGQSGLYNALFQSELSLEGINIVNREAIINLSGSLQLGGVCDNPRVAAQLEYTALQYNTVDAVSIFLNGEPLDDLLSGQ